MIDAHVHLEKGEYCIEWINEFISYAVSRNIDEIYFLEYTHIFKECRSLYDEMSQYNAYQNQWYKKKLKMSRPLKDYIDFIERMKNNHFPVKVKFGLEVCYSPGHEADIERLKKAYPIEDYMEEYEKIADVLKKNNMYIEESSGLAINYGDMELGMNKRMLEAMKNKKVKIVTASDAHIPQDVGKLIPEMYDYLTKEKCILHLNQNMDGFF